MSTSSSKLAAQAKAVNILKKIPVFHGLADEEYQRVMSMCTSTIAKEGQQLFHQGDDGDSLYILLSGEIDVNVKDVGTVHVMQSGEILGEIGLVKKVPRTASAVARTNCVLLQLFSETLHIVVKKHPRIGYVIMKNVARILADRLSESNKK